MNNKYFIVLGGSLDQVPMITKAQDLGLKVICIDYNPHCEGFKYCDITLEVSIVGKDDEVIQALHTLQDTGIVFAGVSTLGVECAILINKICQEFKLIGIDNFTAVATTNKCVRNTILKMENIPIAEYQQIKDINDIRIQYPFVIKPSDSSGSRGVQRVDNDVQLPYAFDEAIKHSSDGYVLIEELLEGPQISIEGFMLNGKMHVTGFADRNYSLNDTYYPFFIENGSDSPSILSPSIIEEAKWIFERGALAVGIKTGVSKGDLIVHKGKVYIIEITSRLSGGGFCSRIVPNQTGIDLVSVVIKHACGLGVTAEILDRQKYNKCICHRYYFHDYGEIVSIEGIDKIKSMTGIKDFIIQRNFKIGDILQPINYINRLMYVITEGDTREEARLNADNAINTINIITKK